ncbi:DUF3455 domain-containing protein [Amycolatopsis saalfeldensis]|uniref:DUF3455 domain-containing protein n=1 Tax=Amycolatopsis saalfeldensis TaxID=394193 RepID=A0A1H8YHX1_9PSEU|nr:DUF3455 domain-containing protein [Amycolatopsis saalfeldensis]SEP51621.1 Protein of unknown function [Amycolatopsis saalfeldensis]
MKRISMALAVGSMVLLGGATACASTDGSTAAGAGAGVKPVAQTAGAPEIVEVPAAVKVPGAARHLGTYQGKGVQIYGCTNGAWTLAQPAAIISDGGKPIALHSKGPVWTSTVDGSTVAATAVPGAAVPHPDAVPELLLKADTTSGKGLFANVTFVQRLNTKGGLAPKGACAAGDQTATPYTADYAFWAAS